MRILIKASTVFFLSIFLFHSGIEAQTFEKLNGPYGGGGKVYEGRNGVLFQVVKSGILNILYKSIDGGSNWVQMPVTPSDWYTPISVGLDGNLYCAKNTKLYRSSDDGQTWGEIKWARPEVVSHISVLFDSTILVATYNKTYRSINGGLNWQQISSMQGIDKFDYSEFKDEVFAISSDTLFISKNKGISWQMLYVDRFGYGSKDFAFANDGTLFVSGDDVIWKFDSNRNFLKKVDPNPGNNGEVQITISSTGRLFAFEWYRSFYSDNLGETWIDLPKPYSYSNFSIHSITTTKSGMLFGLREYNGLYKSNDNGMSWTFSNQGVNYAEVIELDFFSKSKFLALTHEALFYTEDDGKNWNHLIASYNPNSHNYEYNNVFIYGEEIYLLDINRIYYFKNPQSQPVIIKIIVDPIYDQIKLFGNPTTGTLFYTNYFGDIYRSNNKGSTWTKMPLRFIQYFYSFPNGTLITNTNDEIYRSIDDGASWERVFKADLSTGFGWTSRILSSSATGAGIIYRANGRLRIQYTNDNGASWSFQDLDPSNSANLTSEYGQTMNNLDHIFISSNVKDIFRSVDLGRTFNLYTSLENMNKLAISPDQKLYGLTSGAGLYRTISSTSSSKVLIGNLYKDLDYDCTIDSLETGIPNQLVVARNGTQTVSTFSRDNGSFLLPIENGNYNLFVETSNNYWSSCDQNISSALYDFNNMLPIGLQINSLCPYMRIDLQSSLLRRCFEIILYINYENTGTMSAENAYVDVTLDPFFEYISSSIPFSSQNGNVYRFHLGTVAENTKGSFKINAKISCDAKLGQIHCAEAHIYPDTSCIQTSQAIIRTNANCNGDSIDLIIKNEGSKAMASARKWTAVDATSASNIQTLDAGNFYLNPGQVFTKKIVSRDKVLLTAEQDDSYPYNKYSKTEIFSCASNPMPGSLPLNIYPQDEEEPFISKFCEPNRGSFDPNDITGYPYGITDKRFIDHSQELEYIIRFQNTGTDTAFTVRIENELPVNELDIATLTLGASSHPYEYLLDSKGKLIFTFRNILLPDSNIHEKASHGFVQYQIKPVDKLGNGTRILNDASIYFDFNEAVNTNVDLHTIGNPITVKVSDVTNENKVDFQIKPNPLHDFSSVLIHDVYKHERYKLSCVDVFSKELWEMDVMGNKAVISKGEMKPGVYFLILKTDDGMNLKSRKFIVN